MTSPGENRTLTAASNGGACWAVTVFLALFALLAPRAFAEVNRVVIIKVDGLPERLIERYAAEPADGAREGHSRLPWIQHVFEKNGTWIENFYTRGLSLSAPSWSMLDTGRPLEIRGNAEWDRYTLRVYDYLNFFPFYVGYAMSRDVDMPAVQVLDEYHVPLLLDRFPFDQRFQGFQLLQRGVRWKTLESSLKGKFGRPVKDLFDEWQTGFSMKSSVNEQTERELLAKLKDPDIHYLDYFTGEFDHVAHLTNDAIAQRHVIEELDALVGRVWAAIATSPLARTTALILVSDHGMNTSEKIYSQGYNLVDWFNSAEGGAHHVLLNRHPMTEFKLKGLDPFVSEVISPSEEATYLAGESAHYPTAALDLDGNERASISLRNSSLNMIQMLLDQLMHKRLDGRTRHAALNALFEILGRVRRQWSAALDGLDEDLKDLRARIAEQQRKVDAQPKQWTREQRARGSDQAARREANRLEKWKSEERGYSEYSATMRRLLGLDPADFDPGRFNTADLIPRRSLGERNTVEDVRHYAVSLGPAGLVVTPDGSLDFDRSFRYIDYFAALASIRARNNVQPGVSDRPVDFIAAAQNDGVLLWRDGREARVSRRDDGELRYAPVNGAWMAGYALALFEDPKLDAPPGWLDGWHSEAEWLRAAHRTKYSNGAIGIAAEMLEESPAASGYLERKRQLRRADMIVFANDHWNFNVRGFNPGGNHGSFLRVSTHSVLLFAGGEDTGIPRGLRVETPYDSLSFAPTVLALMGKSHAGLPGAAIAEVAR